MNVGRASVSILALALALPLFPATLPSGYTESLFVSGLSNPTAMAFAPDGRLFVCQQGGRLRVIETGVLLPQDFVTLTVNSSGERGLLGVTFDPNFASNQFVYVYYTATTPAIHNRISRFTANGNVAVAGSETVILDLNNLSSATNHNGGAIHFGTDGKLYAAVGDNANGSNSQSHANLLGKILRLNKDGTVPTDNPFYSQNTGNNRMIWALGLRNPFTFSIQPGTGKMHINDVGQSTLEEIDLGAAGANYGWPEAEGTINCSAQPSYTCPIYVYGRSDGCAITGGAFYNPAVPQFPAADVGDYFFADYCNGWIRKLEAGTANMTPFATGINAPVDLQVGNDGALYYLARGAGSIYRIVSTATQAPSITSHPSNQTVTVGQTATFSVSASGTAPLSYQWQRGNPPVDIPNATASTYSLQNAQISDDGAQFRARVTNAYGSATSNPATLTVTFNDPPSGTIVNPPAGTLYTGGQTINYSGTATDPQDGTLGGSAFTWRVDFHHDSHTHPFVQPVSGSTSGSFTIPTSGETSDNVWYRIPLTVTDSGGLTHSTFRDVLPRKSQITVATNPAGMQIRVDDQPQTAPYTFTGVVGIQRTIEAVSPQGQYSFVSWSDGGAIRHTISTPASNTTYTATFTASVPSGNGLSATYYNNRDLTGTTFTRVDPTVNFNWAKGSPAPGIDGDTFSVRWSGQVQPEFSETYTFRTDTDDGVRLWVNGQLIINRWANNAGVSTGTIVLTGGQKYSIVLEYYENQARASASLSWSSPSRSLQIVPQIRLYSQ